MDETRRTIRYGDITITADDADADIIRAAIDEASDEGTVSLADLPLRDLLPSRPDLHTGHTSVEALAHALGATVEECGGNPMTDKPAAAQALGLENIND